MESEEQENTRNTPHAPPPAPHTGFPQKVLELIDRYSLIPPGAAVAVACSGGADSTCLLHVLCELAAGGRIDARLSVCHLDHGLRGEAAREDLAFARAEAERLGLPFHAGSADVNALAAGEKISLEEAARRARYAFFAAAADALGADRVAAGHTADDQAETVLFRVLRGTGLSGLAGMGPRRPLTETTPKSAVQSPELQNKETRKDPGLETRDAGPVMLIRPLLSATHAEAVAYLKAHELPWREDETNRERRFTRNRLRHELIPALEREFNPRVREALVRLGEIARGASELLEALAASHFASCLRGEEEGRIELDLPAVARLDAALELLLFRHALRRLGAHERELGYLHMEQLRELLAAGTGKWRPLPGGARASVVYDRLVLERAVAEPQPADRPGPPGPFQLTLPVPGRVVLPTGARVCALKRAGGKQMLEVIRMVRAHEFPAHASIEVLDLDALPTKDALTVRSRRAGDRFTPLGAGSPKKVKDFFIDQKLPRETRERAAVIASGDEILWVAPHRIAESVKVTAKTRNLLLLRFDEAET